MEHSKYTREQELKLKKEITYKSAWYADDCSSYHQQSTDTFILQEDSVL